MNQSTSQYPIDSTEIYFRNMSKYDLIDHKEMMVLCTIIQKNILLLRAIFSQLSSNIETVILIQKQLNKAKEKEDNEKERFAPDVFMTQVRKIIDNKDKSEEYERIVFMIKKEFKAIEKAKDIMLKANLRLVVSRAKKFPTNIFFPLQEIIQEGNIGLIRAVYRFQPELSIQHGAKFGSYAIWWIRQAIQRAFIDKSRLIRWPSHIHESMEKINRFRSEPNNHDLSDIEIADHLGIKQETVLLLNESKSPLTLDHSFSDDEACTLSNLIPTDKAADPAIQVGNKQLSAAIATLLNKMPDERSAMVIRMRYGIDYPHRYTLDEIGKKINVSRERVRQIEASTLDKLRKPYNKNQLKGFTYD